MDVTNKTLSDTKPSKPEPKVTSEKAQEVVVPAMKKLLAEVLNGFELDPKDTKSRKRIVRAIGFAVGEALHGSPSLQPAGEPLTLSSIERHLVYGLLNSQPKPSPVEDEDGDDSSDGDESEA